MNLSLKVSSKIWPIPALADPDPDTELMGLLWSDTMFYGQHNIEWKPKNVATKKWAWLYNDFNFPSVCPPWSWDQTGRRKPVLMAVKCPGHCCGDLFGARPNMSLNFLTQVTPLPHFTHFTLNLALHRIFFLNPEILTKEELCCWLTLMLAVTSLSDCGDSLASIMSSLI